jgi:hypothetical protein
MTGSFSLKRWRRYGQDRLYVNAPDGSTAGCLDLVSGALTIEDGWADEDLRAALSADPEAAPWLTAPCGRGLTEPAAPVVEAGPPPDEPPQEPSAATGEGEDLAARHPGAAARRRAEEERERLKAKAPVARIFARVLGVHTDERAWRVGADGEEAVGARLERLGEHGWHVLHAIPVGRNGADIDHLLIGPGGVYTINTKNHRGKKVWVGERAVLVDGHRTDYLRNSRFEAERASKLLSAALGRCVPVQAVLVILTGSLVPNVTVKQQPADVLVLDRMDLPGVFRRAPLRMAAEEVEEVFALARRPETWR